ncbi:pH-response regulator protein palH/rim21 [Pseudogymnoascus destructans]|uniref:PH-response regulator protein palH/rim21 n=2 Tax=Pseudogymnoascus destructans TaxID=655981 RepID=L8G9D2_PSED2|nr:pH-response regulator protein palH/rim21 [Pseudogymnoascus destructans]ELR09850.1 hypothetical protein GMDG_04330 [Pseudogymnoascus destructans 20631-21]OAF58282.1 pH-response regulator protein palH/rim21 [Pseudogymnoascus destructans]
MEVRAFWDQAHQPTPTSSSSTMVAVSSCTPFILPSNGIIEFNSTVDVLDQVTLGADAYFYPNCTGSIAPDVTVINGDVPSTDYTSSLSIIYALASTTVTAYMLVILLCITPRSFVSGGTVVLGSRGGFTGSTTVRETGVGIGGRPLLQKVAAISVAISLSIATANTFNIAEEQYSAGYISAVMLQTEVLGSKELKVIMVISDTFLWLAQAQTLIRLFPRQREKVIIKWTALALITLSVIFSTLDDFVYAGYTRPAAFVDAIPALSYLFQIALSLLYSAWVIYYALTKKQYAFYHPRMRNMCLVALISLVSILVPVVFFVVDISMPDVASWGDYVRWVGAAAASAVVWEWVERIEALERNEKKDGVLGREVFDGDEMLEVTPSTILSTDHRGGGGGGTGSGGRGPDRDGPGAAVKASGTGDRWPGLGATARHRIPHPPRRRATSNPIPPQTPSTTTTTNPQNHPTWPARPQPAATPAPHTDTASAESTVYAIRYHPIGDARSVRGGSFDVEAQHEAVPVVAWNEDSTSVSTSKSEGATSAPRPQHQQPPAPTSRIWSAIEVLNPFARSRQRPPPEVSAMTVRRLPRPSRRPEPTEEGGRWDWDVLGKLEDFASKRAERVREIRGGGGGPEKLPVMRIPAPATRRVVPESVSVPDGE